MDLDFIGKIIDAGVGAYSAYSKDKARNDYSQALRDAEQRNYDESKAAHDAYLQYAQGLGGGDGGAAAHAANEAARMQANAAAQQALQQNYAMANKQLKPYADMGKRLIQPVETTYRAGLNSANALNEALSTPEAMSRVGTYADPMEELYKHLPSWMGGSNE